MASNMVSESAVSQSPADAADSENSNGDSGTFPTGASVLALTVWFVLARAMAHMTARRPAMLQAATFSGVTGAILAVAALFAALGWAVLESRGSLRILQTLRALIVIPLALCMASAFFVEPRPELQWGALYAAATTVLISCVLGVVRSIVRQ